MKKSISTKLSIILGITIFITIAITTYISALNSKKNAIYSAEKEMIQSLENSVLNIESILNWHISSMESHWLDLEVLSNSKNLVRTELQAIYQKKMEKNPEMIGYTIVVEPGKFDNKCAQYLHYPGSYDDGRFCEYWMREDGVISRDETLDINFHEELEESGGEWYEIPKNTGENYMYMDYYPLVTGGPEVLMLSLAMPLYKNNEFVGVICRDFVADFMQKEAKKVNSNLFDGQGRVTIYDGNGTITAETNNIELIGENLQEANIVDNYDEILNSILQGKKATWLEKNNYISVVPIKVKGSSKYWQMRVEIPKKVITAKARKQILQQSVIGILATLVSILIIFLIIKRMLNPLNNLTTFSEKVAQGILYENIKIDRDDEIGQLAKAFSIMIARIREVVNGVKNNADNLVSASQQLSSSSEEMSQGASEQASSTEEVSSSMEEMSSNIQQNTDNAQETEKISVVAAKGISEVEKAANESLTSIKQIAEKITIVNDIAFQTNILALNAAVEAARAGEHGRGFAVVAAEVRKLAERSKIAADEIVSLSSYSVKATENAGEMMLKIIPEVEKTARLVQEITAASLEQNSGADQINNAIQQLNQVTQQNAAASEEMSTSSEELSSQAEQLKDMVSFFKVDNAENYKGIRRNTLQQFNQDSKLVKTAGVSSNGGSNKKVLDEKGFDLNLKESNKLDNEFESF